MSTTAERHDNRTESSCSCTSWCAPRTVAEAQAAARTGAGASPAPARASARRVPAASRQAPPRSGAGGCFSACGGARGTPPRDASAHGRGASGWSSRPRPWPALSSGATCEGDDVSSARQYEPIQCCQPGI
eukprot:7175637-Prymnesium_polylepis.1